MAIDILDILSPHRPFTFEAGVIIIPPVTSLTLNFPWLRSFTIDVTYLHSFTVDM